MALSVHQYILIASGILLLLMLVFIIVMWGNWESLIDRKASMTMGLYRTALIASFVMLIALTTEYIRFSRFSTIWPRGPRKMPAYVEGNLTKISKPT